MRMNILTADQVALLTEEQVVDATQAALLEPVRCIDCDAYVPLGWVEFGSVKCAKNINATSGVEYGHRVWSEVRTNILDRIVNEYLGA